MTLRLENGVVQGGLADCLGLCGGQLLNHGATPLFEVFVSHCRMYRASCSGQQPQGKQAFCDQATLRSTTCSGVTVTGNRQRPDARGCAGGLAQGGGYIPRYDVVTGSRQIQAFLSRRFTSRAVNPYGAIAMPDMPPIMMTASTPQLQFATGVVQRDRPLETPFHCPV